MSFDKNKTPEEIKQIVKEKYGAIAEGGSLSSCCGPGASCCDSLSGITFADGYEHLEGYQPDADLSLGCGLPTESSGIKPGHTVLDLGSGAGNDVFVARSMVGAEGRVIGLDMAPEMVTKARANASELGHTNVEFILGEIEAIPLPDASVDVVVSNCVLNLVPDKTKAFTEIFRVLKPGGHFSISDVVLEGELPSALAEAAELYVGCVAGAPQKSEYLEIIRQTGFNDLVIHKEKPISVPRNMIENILGAEQAEDFLQRGAGIKSLTTGAVK